MTFSATMAKHGHTPLRRAKPTWLQLNLGRRCNQACKHCHVDASPTRTEMMDERTARRCVEILRANPELELVDITGGAPELNPHFRMLVQESRALDRRVIDRCNLTILQEPGQEDLADFLAAHQVAITASLPCYLESNVDQQRGSHVFKRSIAALRTLNALGYGQPGSGLTLDLVYNPVGTHLPPAQAGLETDYRERLGEDHGVHFSSLLTITNMPIARFAGDLRRQGRHQEYMQLLINAFNPGTVDGLMCRHLISVGYEGTLYDCDFNQMLEMPVPGSQKTIWDIDVTSEWADQPVAVADHCFGCTAGAGSSCGGALA